MRSWLLLTSVKFFKKIVFKTEQWKENQLGLKFVTQNSASIADLITPAPLLSEYLSFLYVI